MDLISSLIIFMIETVSLNTSINLIINYTIIYIILLLHNFTLFKILKERFFSFT